MIKKIKINKTKKKRIMIKNISLIFLSLMIFSSILLGNFNINYKVDDENTQLSIENDFENQKVLSSSSQIIWTQTWDGPSYERAYSIWGDGSYLYTTGHSGSWEDDSSDLLLIKWDIDGNQIWNKTWGGLGNDCGYSVWGDGTYLYTTGYTTTSKSNDLLLIKWDIVGNQIWNKTWGGIENDAGHSIWGDGMYIYVTGTITNFETYYYDLFLIKWDIDGNQIWDKTWGGIEDDQGYSIWGDGNYLYTSGRTNSFGNGEWDLLIIKWDIDGNQIWNKTWGNIGDDISYSIWGDGIFLYTSGSTKGPSIYDVLFLIKWDTDGNQIWIRTWDNKSSSCGLFVWGDGFYIYTAGHASNEDDLLLVKWDTDGNQIWNQTCAHFGNNRGASIWGDGTYLYVVGESYSISSLFTILLVKMHKDILPKPILQSISTNPNLDGNITLNWNSIVEATSYCIYRDIYSITTVSGLVPISTSTSTSYTDIGLTKGIYFYTVVAKDGNRESDVSNCESVEVQFPNSNNNEIPSYPFEFITSIGVISIVLLTLKKRK
jgi:hypothetical protein